MLARDRAKTVVNQIVAERLPGVNAAPVTDCVIDNASASEIALVARASVTGITERTVDTVVDVTRRPETLSCLAQKGLPMLMQARL
ncbi:succinate dehydrogenase [Lacimonas salitolerans]|uniref:Succinate dehydrogenase n=1 Tax=Lacimonas salitolerans TaxID=1323750 RepID=A0ABW4EFT2_9RHOB